MTGPATDPTRLHVRAMAAALREGTLSARQLVSAHLELARRQDRALNAWVFFDDERARDSADDADRRIAEARRADATDDLPLLLGVPVALKDLVVTRGRPSTAGSRILEGFVGAYDAFIAERLDPGQVGVDERARAHLAAAERLPRLVDGQPGPVHRPTLRGSWAPGRDPPRGRGRWRASRPPGRRGGPRPPA